MKTEKKRTKTASFGVNGRRSHDSSAYYARRINEDQSRNRKKPASYSENPLPEHLANRVLLDSCVSPDKSNRLPPRSVHLMVTSPPYAVGKDYDEDLSLSEYRFSGSAAMRPFSLRLSDISVTGLNSSFDVNHYRNLEAVDSETQTRGLLSKHAPS